MITRIFRAQIYPNLKDEFEKQFADISLNVVRAAKGLVSVEIGKPTPWTPDEYGMISTWENELVLAEFAGENWNQAHIPARMEKFIKQCWIHHYTLY